MSAMLKNIFHTWQQCLQRWGQPWSRRPAFDSATIGNALAERLEAGQPLSRTEQKYLAAALAFHAKTVGEIAVPRASIQFLKHTDSLARVLKLFYSTNHATLPVIRQHTDEVLGYVRLNDLIPFLYKAKAFQLTSLLRPCIFIPATLALDAALQEFRRDRSTMAMVVDELGGTLGLVTLRSIAAEAVADMTDADPALDQLLMIPLPGGRYQVDARTPLAFFLARLGGLTLPAALADDSFDTVGGLVLHLARRLPKAGEMFNIGNGYLLEVVEVDQRRLKKLRLRPEVADDL